MLHSKIKDCPLKFIGYIIFIVFSSISQARDNVTCGITLGRPLENAYGPYDYINPAHQSKLPIVLGAHFTKEVEMLIRGTTGHTPYGDIDYTLRAIPNYHRALYAMSRLQIRDKRTLKNSRSHYSSRCYFERAIYFSPKDAVSYMLYGIHLHRIGDLSEAQVKYEMAEGIGLTTAEFYYNYGLLLLDRKDFEKSRLYAKKAYLLGYPLNHLREKLMVYFK